MISVIIPAYNESAVIGRTLDSVLQALEHEPGEIIVVCNGCHDDTAAVAAGFGKPVRVLELEQGSKIAALNLGDSHANYFPRMYLDADIELSGNALGAVADVLRTGTIHAAAPAMRCEIGNASMPVRSFYRTWLSRPYHRHGHVGSGFVGISEAGRTRFDQFPDIIADDEFIRRQFAAEERQVVPGASFAIHVPQDLRSLMKVKTRSRLGTYQLAARFPDLNRNVRAASVPREDGRERNSSAKADRPDWRDQAIYAALCVAIRARATWQFHRGQFHQWERDETSRRTRN